MNDLFISLAKTPIHDYFVKEKFHKEGKKILRQIAKLLNLAPGSYDIRSNKGGDAVSGEVTLHGEDIYIQLGQFVGMDSFMWRSCKGRKDCTGGMNRWMKWEELSNLPLACEQFKKVMPLTV